MRILHFYKTYWPETFGGVERTINALAVATSSKHVSHSVLTLSDNPASSPQTFNQQTIHQVKRHFSIASTDFSLTGLRPLKRLCEEADIVQLHYPWPYMDLMYFAARINKPTIVTYHADAMASSLLETVYAPLKRQFLRKVTRIVPTSPNYLDSSADLQPFRNKTQVIPLGLEPESYPEPDPAKITSWAARIKGLFFLFVGVLRHYKGLHVLLRAAKKTNAKIVIAGSGFCEDELRQMKEQLGLDNVLFIGQLEEADKIALLRLCTGFVFPSNKRSEAFGLSLAEAAMMGKPLISCEIGTGTSFVNLDGVTGLVVPPDNPDALSKAMNRLVEDAELSQSMGMAAKQRFDSELNAKRMGARYLELYEKVLREKTN